LAVRNDGHASAKNIGIVFALREGIQLKLKPIPGGENTNFQVRTIMAPSTLVSHPGNQRAMIAIADIDFHRQTEDGAIFAGGTTGSMPGQLSGSLPIDEAFLRLDYEIIADDMRPASGALVLETDLLKSFLSW
jgi:hypothetical protein